MGEVLLITDDQCRGERLARDIGTIHVCRVHDLYGDAGLTGSPDQIVSDVSTLTSDAILRLRRALALVRGADTPFLFLIHGNAARGEAQARALGATGTLEAGVLTQAMLAALEGAQSHEEPATPIAERHAGTAQRFLAQAFVPGQPITPKVIDTGGRLIAHAIHEAGVRDWIRAVQRFDDATHQHCLLVAGLAAAFAERLGFAAADRDHLTKAALLHDVGKIDLPRAILNKPGQLTPAERAEIETHPVRGYAMLIGCGFEASLLTVVRSHHEMLDGSGYPDGLRDTEIPDLVRLTTICDIYAALIEQRPYKKSMPGAKAYAVLEGMRGRLDADLVRVFRPVAAAFDPSWRTMA